MCFVLIYIDLSRLVFFYFYFFRDFMDKMKKINCLGDSFFIFLPSTLLYETTHKVFY